MTSTKKFRHSNRDILTILRCLPPHVATKTHRWKENRWDTVSYNAGSLFFSMTVPVTCLSELAEKLTVIEKCPDLFVIRGEPLPHVKRDQPHPRRKHGEQATYCSPEDGHFHFMVDIDKLPLPTGLHLTQGTVLQAIEYAISLFPAEFSDASYYWQLSASAGLHDTTCISAHLFFWSDRKLTDNELKRWGRHVNQQRGIKLIDCAMFNDVQPHYVAKPIFVDGDDPFEVRSGLVSKANDSVTIALPEIVEQPQPSASRESVLSRSNATGKGFDYWLKQIGDHPDGDGFNGPIIRAIASYVATVGGDQVDRDWLRETVRTKIQAADASAHTQDYVDEKASDKFLDSAINGAVEKFGHKKMSRMIPGQKPHHATKRIAANEAVTQLKAALRRFFRRR